MCEERLNDVTNLTLYVTGLTVALCEVIRYCSERNIALTLKHYDAQTKSYYSQIITKRYPVCEYCGTPLWHDSWHCPGCGAS